jgi:putative CocE/NonD family hydrolase
MNPQKSNHFRLAALCLLVCLSFVPLFGQQPSPPVPAQRDTMVAMRDGVKLATDVYVPASGDKWPVILIRTPYNKAAVNLGAAAFFTRHGYAVVIQDVRGRYQSEGVWRFVNDDGRDGADTCQWVGRQSWSNGKIGMYGGSYEGGTQHALAMEGCPYLKTVVPLDAVSNMGYAGMRNGGAFELRFWNWIHFLGLPGSHEARDPKMRAMFDELAKDRKWYLPNLPLRRGTTPLKFAPDYENWLVEAMKHGANDDFWQHVDIIDHADKYQDLPVYLVGGWYDSWAGNTTANYVALSKKNKSPTYLIMGPWTHGGQGRAAHGQVSFTPDAALQPNTLTQLLTWHDHWLKDADNAVGKQTPFASRVRIYVMGAGDGKKDANGRLQHGGFWRDENEWPLARTRYTNYYAHADGRLSTNAPSAAKSSTTYQFDPANPVPSIGGNVSSHNDLLLQGAFDQRGGPQVWNYPLSVPLSARRDVLVFQTEPLAEDLEVTGELTVTLYASSSAKDTDFTAKLIDVYPASADYPAGFDLLLQDGIIRARFRESLKAEKLMLPGQIYKFTIKLYPTANVFKKGHRLRLDLSSSNYPRFDVNPNTGEPLNDHRRVMVADNTIYHDKARPTHITLPVIPARK